MIVQIQGILEEIEGSAARVRPDGGLSYELLLPAFLAARLQDQIGQTITLHTHHFIEGQGQGSNMIPRLAGFATRQDKDFYELFITCKGIGPKRALRAMALPSGQIAAAITDRDSTLLQSLPEVGRRTADTIIATLAGKVDEFVSAAAFASPAGAGGSDANLPANNLARQAMEVLLQLGENRLQAVTWIEQALRAEPRPTDVQLLIQKVYQIKAGG